MPFHKHQLANGLQIVGETIPTALSAAVGFFVRTGSRDEAHPESGVSHFLEHMVFKGTERRTALDVNRDFDRIGASYNASTGEEATIFYASVLPEYLPPVIDLLGDILRPSLRPEDFDTEKKVILEEIGMYEDMPGFLAYDNAKQLYFGEHSLGNSILGTIESITALRREQMADYFERRYVARNIVVSLAGQLDWDATVALLEGHCAGWPGGAARREDVRETPGTGQLRLMTTSKFTQENVVLMSAGPPADSPLRYAAELLATAVGDPSGSKLYWALVDPGHAESADTSYSQYEGTGAFYTSFACEPEDAGQNLALTREVLAAVQASGITEDELRQARNKLLSRMVRGSERPRGRMMAVGMGWIYLGEYRSVDEELAAFEAVDLAQVREVLDRYPLSRTTTLAVGPVSSLDGGGQPG